MIFFYTGNNIADMVCLCYSELCTWFTSSVSNRKYWIDRKVIWSIWLEVIYDGQWGDQTAALLSPILLVVYRDKSLMMKNDGEKQFTQSLSLSAGRHCVSMLCNVLPNSAFSSSGSQSLSGPMHLLDWHRQSAVFSYWASSSLKTYTH